MQIRFLYSDSICKSPYVASLKMVFTYSNAPTSCRRWQMAQTHFFLHIGDTAQNSWSEKRHKKWLLQLQCGAYFFIRGIEYCQNSKGLSIISKLCLWWNKFKIFFWPNLQLQSQNTFPWKIIEILENYNQGFK